MATKIARANHQEREARQYIVLRDEVKTLTDRKNALSKNLKDFLQNHGENLDGGHQEFIFSEPVTVGGEVFVGLVNRRKNSQTIDLDEVEKVLAENGIDRSRVFKQVTIEEFDQDEFFALNQSDEIPDADVDRVFKDNITWALEVIKD